MFFSRIIVAVFFMAIMVSIGILVKVLIKLIDNISNEKITAVERFGYF